MEERGEVIIPDNILHVGLLGKLEYLQMHLVDIVSDLFVPQEV